MTYFTSQNTEGFTASDLALLNAAMDRIVARAKQDISNELILENYIQNASDMLLSNCSDAEYRHGLTAQDVEYEIFSVINRTMRKTEA